MKKVIFLFSLIFTFFSCSDDEPNYNAENEADIIKYIADNNLTAKKK